MDSSWKGLGASPYPESACSERVMRIKICHFVSFSTEECYWPFSRKVSGIHCTSTADVLTRHGLLPGIPSAGASPQVPPTRHWHIHHSTLPPCSEPFDNFPLHLELRKGSSRGLWLLPGSPGARQDLSLLWGFVPAAPCLLGFEQLRARLPQCKSLLPELPVM